jgi:hypothetical protein
MNYFETPTQWRIPEEAIRRSMTEMAIDGARGHEGVAMWLGRYEGNTAVVTHVAALRGAGVRKSPDQLRISADLVNDLTDRAIELGLVLIGQIHSHGPMHGTFLSLTDKKFGISVPGYLSAVAPDYAMRPSTSINECGVHLFEKGHGWIRLTPEQVGERVLVVQSPRVPVLIVGSL